MGVPTTADSRKAVTATVINDTTSTLVLCTKAIPVVVRARVLLVAKRVRDCGSLEITEVAWCSGVARRQVSHWPNQELNGGQVLCSELCGVVQWLLRVCLDL